jgi:hypothetical protein
MGCVGRAAAIPAREQLVSGVKTFADQIRGAADLRLKIFQRFQHPDCVINRSV